MNKDLSRELIEHPGDEVQDGLFWSELDAAFGKLSSKSSPFGA
jgi:hypothetical protein